MARENTGILMRCGRCLQQSVVSEMKYAKDGTTLVCTNCRGLSIQEHLEKLRRKRQVQFDITPPSSATRYACTSCGFTFSRKNLKPGRCPYCAKATIVEQDSISSASLLDDR
jgi:predicted Zn-ribbon and HTH transcriptional regulator